MNELKPEDVMRALEHCATEAKCDGCVLENTPHCECELMEAALALLREKDATLEMCAETIKRQDKEIAEKDAEIERLSFFNNAKAEAVREHTITEFLERFDKAVSNTFVHYGWYIKQIIIPKIAKEMRGEQT